MPNGASQCRDQPGPNRCLIDRACPLPLAKCSHRHWAACSRHLREGQGRQGTLSTSIFSTPPRRYSHSGLSQPGRLGSMDPPLPSTFEEQPAPWILRGRAWWFITSLIGKGPLGSGDFDPLEASSERWATEEGAFQGGLGAVQIIRYKNSPVGTSSAFCYVSPRSL